LLVVGRVFVRVRHEVVIEVEIDIRLRDLVLHDHCVGNAADDSVGDLFEEVLVHGLVVAGVPVVGAAVLASFNYKNNVLVHRSKL